MSLRRVIADDAPILVIDTNIFDASPDLSGALWLRLAAATRDGVAAVVVPEIVLREFARHRTEKRNNPRGIVRASVAALKQKAIAAGIDPELVQLRNFAAFETATEPDSKDVVLAELSAELSDLGFTIAPLPTVSTEEMVAWSLSRKEPFDQSDKGYRDALTWLNLCEVGRENRESDHTVVLVSADNDFGPSVGTDGDAKFHDSLRQRLTDQDLVSTVVFTKNIWLRS